MNISHDSKQITIDLKHQTLSPPPVPPSPQKMIPSMPTTNRTLIESEISSFGLSSQRAEDNRRLDQLH